MAPFVPFYELKRELASILAGHFNHPELDQETIAHEFTSPPNIAMGHLALPCFRFAKILGRSATDITQSLVETISSPTLKVTTAGSYANFRWSVDLLYERTLSETFGKKERYGSDTSGKGSRIIIEYCSPNIAKRLAVHHIRSTLIGNTLANIYGFLGYETIRINFVGDWGTQFARLLAAVDKWGDKSRLTTDDIPGSMEVLLELYVRFHKELELNPQYLELASHWLRRLEEQEPEATRLWKLIREISVCSMEATLARLNVHFDHVEGESRYVPQIGRTLELVKDKAHAVMSEGAWIVDIPGIPTPALVQKKDGTTLYLTRDLAAALDRHERFGFDKMFYVVSEQQRLHFQLLKGVLTKMGYAWADAAEHLSFGTVLFGSEKMSTREGRVVLLDDLLNEAKRLAAAECAERNPDLVDKDTVAEQVGLAAIVFGELSAHRSRDIEFDWKQALAFDGETGPYVQYAAVRCHSLLEKAREKGETETGPLRLEGAEVTAEEEGLILLLSRLGMALHDAIRDNEPYHLTHYLIELAKGFNRFYHKLPVLQVSDTQQRRIRLNLVRATSQTLQNGLKLLGIPCPTEM